MRRNPSRALLPVEIHPLTLLEEDRLEEAAVALDALLLAPVALARWCHRVRWARETALGARARDDAGQHSLATSLKLPLGAAASTRADREPPTEETPPARIDETTDAILRLGAEQALAAGLIGNDSLREVLSSPETLEALADRVHEDPESFLWQELREGPTDVDAEAEDEPAIGKLAAATAAAPAAERPWCLILGPDGSVPPDPWTTARLETAPCLPREPDAAPAEPAEEDAKPAPAKKARGKAQSKEGQGLKKAKKTKKAPRPLKDGDLILRGDSFPPGARLEVTFVDDVKLAQLEEALAALGHGIPSRQGGSEAVLSEALREGLIAPDLTTAASPGGHLEERFRRTRDGWTPGRMVVLVVVHASQ